MDSRVHRLSAAVVLRFGHDLALDWHQWVTLGRQVKADRLGRANARMYEANWLEWRCNNTQCPARAIVSLADMGRALSALVGPKHPMGGRVPSGYCPHY